MKNTINVKMAFSANEQKIDLKTTIMKDGSIVNPATLSREMLNFCATIAANKARALQRTIVGFTGSEITVELPEGVDLNKLEEIVNEEVNAQLDNVEVDVELEPEETDYIEQFTTQMEVIDPLETANEEHVEEATTATEETDPTDNGTLEVAAPAAEAAAEPVVPTPDSVPEQVGIGAPTPSDDQPAVFTAKTQKKVAPTTTAAPRNVSIFTSGDKTAAFKAKFFGDLKKG